MPLKLPATEMLTNFSTNVAALRKGLGYSQEDLANRLKAGRTTISNWEKGVAYPSFSDLLALAIVLRTTLDELVGATPVNQNGKHELFSSAEPGRPNIVLLDRSSAETLPAHIDLQAHFKGMPAFRLPEPPFAEGLFICTQYFGDPMTPTLRSGEWLVAKHLPVSMASLNLGEVYVVVTKLGVICRRLMSVPSAERNTLRMVFGSDNPMYEPVELKGDKVIHLFRCQARLSYHFESQHNGGLVARPMTTRSTVRGTKRKAS